MKARLSFLKNIRFTGTLCIILFIISIFLVYTYSDYTYDSAYISDKIEKIEFSVLDDTFDRQLANETKDKLNYEDEGQLAVGKFDFFNPKAMMLKVTIAPIEYEGTYFLLNTNSRTKEYIDVYIEDKEGVSVYPQIISYDRNGEFDYYLLPESDEETEVYLYFDEEYGTNGFSRPTFLVGTESELLLLEGSKSASDFVIAISLLLLSLFIYIVFYITSIDKYKVIKVFAFSFIIIALQSIIFSPYITFAFNEFSQFFKMAKTVTYFALSGLAFSVPLLYVFDKKIHKFYIANIVFCGIAIFIEYYLMKTNTVLAIEFMDFYNIYFMFIAIYSLVLNLYNFEDESDAVSIFRLMSFSAMVVMNMFFYYYETESATNSLKNPYYFILLVYVISVILYICSILKYRSQSIADTKMFLYDEKETIDRLYKSNKNAITTTNIQQISQNILSDIQGIYPNLKSAMIVHRDLNRKLTITADLNVKGDIDRHAQKLFKKHYKRIPKSSFVTYFSGERAVLSFRSSTGEALLIYIKNDKQLTELDELASEILASPVLLSFNNCRIYDEMANTERELLYAVGNLTYLKSGGKGSVWRLGEFCYLLAKNTGLSEKIAQNLRVASYIHDIGKVGMSDALVNFEKISPMEEHLYYKHTQIGHDMLSKFSSESMKLAGICSLYHHEKYNGKGYLGKVADEVPIEARIVTICIEFESYLAKLFEERRDAIDIEILEEAYSYLSLNKQTLFDPLLVQLFIKDKQSIEAIVEQSKGGIFQREAMEFDGEKVEQKEEVAEEVTEEGKDKK